MTRVAKEGDWTVLVWISDDGRYPTTRNAALQVFDNEVDAKRYARANRDDLTRSDVRPSIPGEKEFA